MSRTETTGTAVDDGGEEEFDPIGTLALIGVYFAILVLAWIYVYYVEFLSRDLVIVG